MLGKLFKQDLKASGKYFIPMYLVFLGIMVATKVIDVIYGVIRSNNAILNVLNGIAITTTILAFFAVNISTYIFIIMYFYRKCISHEGYLTFTLPVKTGTHLISKTLTGVIWQVLTLAVNVLSLAILVLGEDLGPFFSELSRIFNDVTEGGFGLIFIELIIFGLLTTFAVVLMFYVSLSIGQLFNRHKVAGAVGAFFAIYIIIEIVGGILFVMLALYDFPRTMEVMPGIQAVQYVLCILIALAAVLIGIFYAGTYFLLNKKLNLE